MSGSAGQRGRDARQLVERVRLIAKVEDEVAAEFAAWDVARIERIEAILRANRMHEGSCAYVVAAQGAMSAECDCWLANPPEAPA